MKGVDASQSTLFHFCAFQGFDNGPVKVSELFLPADIAFIGNDASAGYKLGQALVRVRSACDSQGLNTNTNACRQ